MRSVFAKSHRKKIALESSEKPSQQHTQSGYLRIFFHTSIPMNAKENALVLNFRTLELKVNKASHFVVCILVTCWDNLDGFFLFKIVFFKPRVSLPEFKNPTRRMNAEKWKCLRIVIIWFWEPKTSINRFSWRIVQQFAADQLKLKTTS